MNNFIQNKLVYSEGEYNGLIKNSLSVDGAIISETNYIKNQNPQWHCHENIHVSFVMQEAKSETTKREVYTQKKGNTLFYHSGEMHRYTTYDEISKSINLEIPWSFLEAKSLDHKHLKQNIEDKIDSKSLMLSMQKELTLNSDESSTNILSLLLDLVSNSNDDTHFPTWAMQLHNLLHDCWNESLSLEDISLKISVHPVTISKNFRRYFGYTLGEYRRKIKIEKSISLIKETNMSLSEIAFYCQFSDQSHFIRNFKKYTGYLPSKFSKF